MLSDLPVCFTSSIKFLSTIFNSSLSTFSNSANILYECLFQPNLSTDSCSKGNDSLLPNLYCL